MYNTDQQDQLKLESPTSNANSEQTGIDVTNDSPFLGDPSVYAGSFAYPELEQKLKVFQEFVEARAIDELTDPIDDWSVFKVRLAQVKHFYKQGLFDLKLRSAYMRLNEFLETVDAKGEPDYWKGRTLVYELNDVFQQSPSINESAYRDGESVVEELRAAAVDWENYSVTETFDRRLIREKVLFCTCRGNELKRRGDTKGALRLFDWLYDFTNRKLRNELLPCFATLANLCYHLGSVYRILEQHDKAEVNYSEALNFYRERAKHRGDANWDDFLWVTRRLAMCIGLGFGWVNLTRGHLQRAENALTTARCMLARVPNNVITFYIEMLYGTIKRCRAGSNQVELREAIDSLKDAREHFKRLGHRRYEARACWEIGLALNQVGQLDEADSYLEIINDYEKTKLDFKWQANIHVLRSRLERNKGNLERALSEAQLATRNADECEEILPKVDALICRGEARLAQVGFANQRKGTFEAIRQDFEQALRLLHQKGRDDRSDSPSNPKIAAVCELRIAQCYLRGGEHTQAIRCFQQWEFLRTNVEHGWVRELADEVRAEFDRESEDYFIPSTDPSRWNYPERVADLRKWLLNRALALSENNWSKAAKLIGVERATLYQWRHSPKEPGKRGRPSKKSDSAGGLVNLTSLTK